MLVRVQKTPHVAEKEQDRPTMFTMFDCKVQWNPPQKMFLSEKVCPVSQLQYGVSTSSLPPFIVDLLTYKFYPSSNSFFSMGILEGVEWLISQAGPKQQ